MQQRFQSIPLRTPGETQANISEGISRFEQEYMGRGPKDIHTHLLGDLVVVRLRGVLTAAEQHLVMSLPAEKGRDLLKQVRTHLVETTRPVMEAMVEKVTGVKVVTMHHDISTITREKLILRAYLNGSSWFSSPRTHRRGWTRTTGNENGPRHRRRTRAE